MACRVHENDDEVKDGECKIRDRTLEEILEAVGWKPRPLEETIEEMLK